MSKRKRSQARGSKGQPLDQARPVEANLPARDQSFSAAPGWILPAVAVAAGGLALALYLATLAPAVTFADAGELAAAVYRLDVAHPPGFPLYLLLGKLFTLVGPWGTVAQRLSAFSALGAATAVGLLAAALATALPLERRTGSRRDRRATERAALSRWPGWFLPLLALAAATLLATLRTLWEQATLTEVYALNMALSAGLLLLLVHHQRASVRGDPVAADRAMAGAALLAGLGLGNHLTLLFVAAGVFLGAWIQEGASFWQRRRLLVRAGLLLLGLSVYLYLPLRAQAQPPLNWGGIDSLASFWRHVSARQYQVNFAPGPLTWGRQLGFFFPRLWDEFSPLPLALVPLGLYRLYRRQRPLAWATIAGAGLTALYALNYEIAEDQETYWLLFFFFLAWWIGYGLLQLADWTRQRWGKERLLLPAVAGMALLLLVWPLLGNWSRCDRRHYHYAEAYARDVLDNLPENALLLTADWNLYAPAYYLQQVEGVRTDVVLIDQLLLQRSWYLQTVERHFSWLAAGAAPEIEAYRVQLLDFEDGPPYDAAKIQERYQAMQNALLRTAAGQGRPLFITAEAEYMQLIGGSRPGKETVGDRFISRLAGQPARGPGGVGEEYLWVPEALALRLLPEPPGTLPQEQFQQPALKDGRRHDELTEKVVAKYVDFWLRRGMYLQADGDCPAARVAYQEALAINPATTAAQQGLLTCPVEGP